MAEQVDKLVDTTVAKAVNVKVHAADAIEEAARKLRQANLEGRGDDVKALVNDIESRAAQLRDEVDRKVEPVETFIVEHPLASVMIAIGIGFMVGSLMTARRD
jgi:ElaB/YqjD/DUF883 family membrane-anchored ribosome-binding protein